MLIKLQIRFSEVFFGVLLTVAIFAMGFVVASSIYKLQRQEQQAAAERPANVGHTQFG